MSIFKILHPVFFLFLVCSLHAQPKHKVLEEGLIKYSISMDGEDEIAHILNNSVMNLYLKNKRSRIDFSVMGGLANFQLIDNVHDNLMTVLMDIPTFYEKTAIRLDAETKFFRRFSKIKSKNQAPSQHSSPIRYYKSKRKKIANYVCYKAVVQLNDKDQIVLYLTDKIHPEVPTELQKPFGELEGFPLAAEMQIDGVVLKVQAEKVQRKSIQLDAFEIPDSYTHKSIEQFMEDIQREMGADTGAIGL